MLTKSDLKAIDKIVSSRVREEVDESLSRELTPIKKDIKSIKRDMKVVKNDIKHMSKTHDEGIVYLGRRVKNIEKHLKIPTVENPPPQN